MLLCEDDHLLCNPSRECLLTMEVTNNAVRQLKAECRIEGVFRPPKLKRCSMNEEGRLSGKTALP